MLAARICRRTRRRSWANSRPRWREPGPRSDSGLTLIARASQALTGIHLLSTGECVGDVRVLAERYGLSTVGTLVEEKLPAAEHGEAADPGAHLAAFDRLDTQLAEAHAASPLPVAPANLGAISGFLIELRRKHF